MSTANIRQVQNHGKERDWKKNKRFIPLNGEIIVYDKDEVYNYPRIKIGDGVTPLNRLPFIAMPDWNEEEETAYGFIKNKPFGDNSDGTVTKIDNKYLPDTITPNTLILNSSTEGSTKKFKITIDDSGTISAVEVQ